MKTFHHVCSVCDHVYGFTTADHVFRACTPCHISIFDGLLVDSLASHGYCSEACCEKHFATLVARSALSHERATQDTTISL